MISIRKQFLFIHVPKTGGNSLQSVLRHYSEDDIVIRGKHQDGVERFGIRNKHYDITKHATLSHYQAVLPFETYRSLFKFATIRNPWDRMISLYFSPHRGRVKWNRHTFLALLKQTPTLRSFIQIPASGPVSNKLDREIDFLLRFERLNDDFKRVCDKLDIPFVPPPMINRSTREHYSKYYDHRLMEIVRRKFFEEINLGNYRFEQI